MFDWTDLFVGSLAVVIGGLALLSGMLNWEASFRLPKAKRIEDRYGRRTARIFYAALGGILIVLGAGIMAGFGPFAG